MEKLLNIYDKISENRINLISISSLLVMMILGFVIFFYSLTLNEHSWVDRADATDISTEKNNQASSGNYVII